MRDNLVIFGPTASGKSCLAMELAKKHGGEIINMDSMQIYQGMDVATAKPTKEDQEMIPHHLFDIVEPCEAFTTVDYKVLALKTIKDIKKRGHIPILVGGTGLYLSSLYYDFDFRKKDDEKRKNIEKLYEVGGTSALQREARIKYPDLLETIDPANPHRLMRLLESGSVKNEKKRSDLPLCLFILETDREVLNQRMKRRIDEMHSNGLLEEVEEIFSRYGQKEYLQAFKGIGYKEYFPYLKGEISLEEAKERHHISTRQYAKRQRTWGRNQYNDGIYIQGSLSTQEKIKKIEEQWR